MKGSSKTQRGEHHTHQSRQSIPDLIKSTTQQRRQEAHRKQHRDPGRFNHEPGQVREDLQQPVVALAFRADVTEARDKKLLRPVQMHIPNRFGRLNQQSVHTLVVEKLLLGEKAHPGRDQRRCEAVGDHEQAEDHHGNPTKGDHNTDDQDSG